jgi:hypothetical protein
MAKHVFIKRSKYHIQQQVRNKYPVFHRPLRDLARKLQLSGKPSCQVVVFLATFRRLWVFQSRKRDMRDISRQVEHLAQELRELRLQLENTNSQPQTAGEYSRVLSHVLGPRLVPDLTELVNQLTHFLWQYIDSAASPPREVDFALQSQRLQQATEMLRRLHFASSPQHAEPPVAFVARMTETVDRLLESNPKPVVINKSPDHGLVTIRLERSA